MTTPGLLMALVFSVWFVIAISLILIWNEIRKFRQAYEKESNRYWDKYLRRLSDKKNLEKRESL